MHAAKLFMYCVLYSICTIPSTFYIDKESDFRWNNSLNLVRYYVGSYFVTLDS